MLATAVTGFFASVPTAQASQTCQASLGPWPAATGPAPNAAALTGDQQQTAALIISIGKQRNLPPRAWQIAIQAGMTESELRNLNGGDRDSLGIFQMRPSMGWGTVAQLQDPVYEINKFYDVLIAVPGWDTMRPGDAAQAVERSGFPQRYHAWEALATALLSQAGVADPTGCAGITTVGANGTTAAAKIAIQVALAQQGKPYVWGATGPDTFDCSGLMLFAYRAAGITLPRVADQQYTAGAHLPVAQAQPGDLLFWADASGNPAAIHHVAMYLGDGKIVEAQQSGMPVHIRAVSFGEGELVATATRPGVSQV
jgi:peptidoglycan DL-endopeptidase CwlO